MRGPVWSVAIGLLGTISTFGAVKFSLPPAAPSWVKLGSSKKLQVSGAALEHQSAGLTEFLVIHESKAPDEPRIGRVAVTARATTYTPLAWPQHAEWPVDVESICAMPGSPGRYLMLASAGRLFTVEVSGKQVSLVGAPIDFLRPEGWSAPNYEAFAVQQVDGRLFAVWADRGDEAAPSRLFWGPFDAEKGPTIAGFFDVRVPWPPPEQTREIVDLKVDAAGVVWAMAAWDDHDVTHYRSALYALGVIWDPSSSIGYRPNPNLVPVRVLLGHKVEALELIPGPDGGFAFGADDSDNGGWFLLETSMLAARH